MVDGIIRLEETQASDVMTPRVDLIGIDLNDPPEEGERVAQSVNFRYLPVYRDSLDHAEGFLDVPRYLLSEDRKIETAMVQPFFVPETVPLDTLLGTFQRENRRVAFVVDEFGKGYRQKPDGHQDHTGDHHAAGAPALPHGARRQREHGQCQQADAVDQADELCSIPQT